MTPFETGEPSGAIFWAMVYLGTLWLSGLVLFILLLPRVWFAKGSGGLVCPWRIEWLDFGLFIWYCLVALFLAQGAALLLGKINGGEGEAGIGWPAIVGGAFMQIGLIAVFLVFRWTHWPLFTAPLNPRPAPWYSIAGQGCHCFLAFFPVISALGLGWGYLLRLAREAGWPLPWEAQEIVKWIATDGDLGQRAALILMAVLLAPVAEEMIFRGAIYRFLKSRWGSIPAMLASGAAFASIHQSVSGFPTLWAIGVSLCLAYELSGDLRVPMVFHALFNLNTIILLLLAPELTGF